MSPKPLIAKKSEYHHGNLRSALIEAGRAALKSVSAQDLSLRYLARMVGVSEAAPSRHFSGIDELLAHIAATGFRELAAMRIEIQRSGDTPLSVAYRMMRVYVEFAEQHKGLFGLMIGPRIAFRETYPELTEESGKSFQLFSNAIEALALESGWSADDLNLITHAAWSVEHGLATLILSDRVPRSDRPLPVVDMIDFSIRCLLGSIVSGPDGFREATKNCVESSVAPMCDKKSRARGTVRQRR